VDSQTPSRFDNWTCPKIDTVISYPHGLEFKTQGKSELLRHTAVANANLAVNP